MPSLKKFCSYLPLFFFRGETPDIIFPDSFYQCFSCDKLSLVLLQQFFYLFNNVDDVSGEKDEFSRGRVSFFINHLFNAN